MSDGSIEELALENLKEYTSYITKGRVLPHLDLKPVHRRILWAMIKMNARNGSGRFMKCASIIGETLKYHPHGSTSVYGALCNLINTPNSLIEGRGNFGSYLGDKPAAERYTEARTSELFEQLIDNKMFDIGDFIDNYDNSLVEPSLLQTKLPLASLIGIHGIGVGLVTMLPSFSLDFLKHQIVDLLSNSSTDMTPIYAYGGYYYENKIYPEFQIVQKNNKEYLHITEIPKTCNISILRNNELLHELLASNLIEIINESKLNNISIYIHAPKDIQQLIINSVAKPVITNFRYYWNRLRMYNYCQIWLSERIKFVKKREYYKLTKQWKSDFIDNCLTVIDKVCDQGKKVNFTSLVNETVTSTYNVDSIYYEAQKHIPSIEEIKKIILKKSINSICQKNTKLSSIEKISEDKIIKIIIDEVNSVISGEKNTKPLNKWIGYAKYEIKIKRYIIIRGVSVEVRFKPIPRFNNCVTSDNIFVVYNDCSTQLIPNNFFGLVNSVDKQVVGFMVANRPVIIITESNKLYVLFRLSIIKELIKIAFVAKKLQVVSNGKSKDIAIIGRLTIDNVTSYKILEI